MGFLSFVIRSGAVCVCDVIMNYLLLLIHVQRKRKECFFLSFSCVSIGRLHFISVCILYTQQVINIEMERMLCECVQIGQNTKQIEKEKLHLLFLFSSSSFGRSQCPFARTSKQRNANRCNVQLNKSKYSFQRLP